MLTVLLCSCAPVRGKLLIMEGSFFNARGMYTEAITAYLEALEYDDAVPYAEYGLGTMYFALDEGEAALERFAAAEAAAALLPGEHRELGYRIHYNTGVVRFRRGDYPDAVEEFRLALRVDGSRVEAKRNLELSLLAIQGQSDAGSASFIEAGSDNTGTDTLFEYLRQKEQERWKSREWTGDAETPGPDY
jgi:Ca-activated chloride channel family protein